MTAIFSFLSGAMGRWLLEKIFGIYERKQDHEQELALREQQERIDTASHSRNLELLEKQAALKVQLSEVEHRGAMEAKDADALIESIRSYKPTGVSWIDAWNGSVRPTMANVCIVMWLGLVVVFAPSSFEAMDAPRRMAIGVLIVEFTLNLIGTVLGWYFGTRSLMPGKK